MQHIANTPRGRLAKNQQDLLNIAVNASSMVEEVLEHPVCDFGFAVPRSDGLQKMDDKTFHNTITSIMKCRPSARLWDVIPDVPYTEIPYLDHSPEAFKMDYSGRAALLADEFLRRPKMVGFRWELHNVTADGEHSPQGPPSVSILIYESVEDLGDTIIPITINTRYRANF